MTNNFADPADNTLPKTFINQKEVAEGRWTYRHIGAGIGLLGGTFQMLEDAHALRKQGVDVVIAIVETHGRAETKEQLMPKENRTRIKLISDG